MTRVVVLCCEGDWQRHLAGRVAHEFELAGVVWQRAQSHASLRERLRRYKDPRVLLRHLHARLALVPCERRAADAARELRGTHKAQLGDASRAPSMVTDNINSAEVLRFVRDARPELVLVNGTSLVRGGLLEHARTLRWGMLNLHTGLSPYSRGGNCNLFMLIEGHPELVGVTVHHIDPGIDSGDIVLSARVPMREDDCWETLDARSFHTGVELLVRAAHLVVQGRAPRVPQWDEGKLFLRRTGYVYEPWHRLQANRLIERGLVRDYLARRAERDAGARLVEEGA